ncbi:rRNA-binding ribosome biosynthesis protein rpf2 [Chytridiales sp. JEL 0842]|nr:rRNA-binding ribosome biosynthesis protein rpf2 [Chytridiales sp. JEL 0842]
MSTDVLKDLYAMKQPNAVLFSKRNDLHPFDDPRPLEFLSSKNDAALIAFASHSKKRPHNFIIARMFDHQVLDLVEFGIVRELPTSAFEGVPQPLVGHKPVLVFQGDLFEVNETYKSIKNVLVDFFRGEVADMVNLKGVNHVLGVTVETSGNIQIRGYHVKLLKRQVTLPGAEGPAVTSSKLPKVALEECGPAIEFELRRTRFGDAATYKEALKVPAELKQKKVKNIDHDEIGDKMGRIHMEKQDLSKLQVRKMKGLKRSRKDGDEDEEEKEQGSRPQRAKRTA